MLLYNFLLFAIGAFIGAVTTSIGGAASLAPIIAIFLFILAAAGFRSGGSIFNIFGVQSMLGLTASSKGARSGFGVKPGGFQASKLRGPSGIGTKVGKTAKRGISKVIGAGKKIAFAAGGKRITAIGRRISAAVPGARNTPARLIGKVRDASRKSDVEAAATAIVALSKVGMSRDKELAKAFPSNKRTSIFLGAPDKNVTRLSTLMPGSVGRREKSLSEASKRRRELLFGENAQNKTFVEEVNKRAVAIQKEEVSKKELAAESAYMWGTKKEWSTAQKEYLLAKDDLKNVQKVLNTAGFSQKATPPTSLSSMSFKGLMTGYGNVSAVGAAAAWLLTRKGGTTSITPSPFTPPTSPIGGGPGVAPPPPPVTGQIKGNQPMSPPPGPGMMPPVNPETLAKEAKKQRMIEETINAIRNQQQVTSNETLNRIAAMENVEKRERTREAKVKEMKASAASAMEDLLKEEAQKRSQETNAMIERQKRADERLAEAEKRATEATLDSLYKTMQEGKRNDPEFFTKPEGQKVISELKKGGFTVNDPDRRVHEIYSYLAMNPLEIAQENFNKAEERVNDAQKELDAARKAPRTNKKEFNERLKQVTENAENISKQYDEQLKRLNDEKKKRQKELEKEQQLEMGM